MLLLQFVPFIQRKFDQANARGLKLMRVWLSYSGLLRCSWWQMHR